MASRACTSRASPTRRHRNGVLSGLFLARRLISYEYAQAAERRHPAARARLYARHLLNVVTDPIDTATFLAHWVTRRTLAERKFPSVILRNRTNRFSLEIHGEQAPRADSRVTLTEHTDALGMPQLRMDWRYSRGDIESVAAYAGRDGAGVRPQRRRSAGL